MSGSGPGVWEQLHALLLSRLRALRMAHNFKRLLVCYERRADIHHALLALGCCLVCFRRLRR
jgi:hypothetical protein